MKPGRVRRAGWSLFVATATFVAGLWIGLENKRPTFLPQYSISALVYALESGVISSGATLQSSDVLAYTKPFVSEGRKDNDRKMYGVALYRDNERTVILYVHGGELYGASLLSGGGAQFEKWYFCDAEKLNKHIGLALGKN